MERVFVSIKETTKILGLGRSTIYKMIGDQQLATVKIGSRRLVKVDALQSFIEASGQPQASRMP